MSKVQIDYFRKALYLAASKNVVPGFEKDGDAVRLVRDAAVSGIYPGRDYKELNAAELRQVIEELELGDLNEMITYNQLKSIRYYGCLLGLIYCDFTGIKFVSDGRNYTTEEAREYCKILFDNKMKLPEVIMRLLYSNWINPKCNDFLIQCGFRKRILHKDKLYYEKLTKKEAKYLIMRLVEIHDKATKSNSNNNLINYENN
jgi:hypothetical protein